MSESKKIKYIFIAIAVVVVVVGVIKSGGSI